MLTDRTLPNLIPNLIPNLTSRESLLEITVKSVYHRPLLDLCPRGKITLSSMRLWFIHAVIPILPIAGKITICSVHSSNLKSEGNIGASWCGGLVRER
jgi:hypothetical protein